MRPEILRAAQVEKAEFFVIATDDPETNIETAKRVRKLYPHLKIIARARNRQHVHLLLDAGVEPVRETFFSSLEMSRMVLCGLGLSEEQATRGSAAFRRHDEEVPGLPAPVLQRSRRADQKRSRGAGRSWRRCSRPTSWKTVAR
ncbi:glutathione-regulated potassium-efflux system protein KefB [Pseudomonas aeruginosa]|nr:glutathione-regulated potassium-efflux system protein KefB [Pseudomonas aeruginosa]